MAKITVKSNNTEIIHDFPTTMNVARALTEIDHFKKMVESVAKANKKLKPILGEEAEYKQEREFPTRGWTKEMDKYVLKNYNQMTAEEIGQYLGRTKACIYQRYRILCGRRVRK